MEKRLEWIDSLKGFCIFLVVFGHLSPEAEIERYIYSFHMFFFFAVSGFLFNSKSGISHIFLIKKCKSLLIPYLFWNVASTIYAIINTGNFAKALSTMLTIDGSIGWNRPIWFLPVLFFTVIIYSLLNRYIPFSIGLCLTISPIIWYFLKGKLFILKFDIVPIALFFFSLGIVIRKLFMSNFFKKNKLKISLLFLLFTAIIHIVFGVYLNKRIIFTYSKFYNYSYCLLAGIGGVVFYFVLFHILRPNKILSYLGKRTLFIMCTHYWYLTGINRITQKFFSYDIWHTRGTFKAFIYGIILILLISGTMYILELLCIKYPRIKKLALIVGLYA